MSDPEFEPAYEGADAGDGYNFGGWGGWNVGNKRRNCHETMSSD